LLGAPFGVGGQVKVKSFSGETAHLALLTEVVLRKDGKDSRMKVVSVEEKGGSLLFKFAGIDSPEAARALQGAEIIVPRDAAAPLGEDEYYIEDLKGVCVYYGAEFLGHIRDVMEGGGGDLVELELPGGETRLIPFRKEFFDKIDLQTGRADLAVRWIIEEGEVA
jgi:16S rRNA processing protein RimM